LPYPGLALPAPLRRGRRKSGDGEPSPYGGDVINGSGAGQWLRLGVRQQSCRRLGGIRRRQLRCRTPRRKRKSIASVLTIPLPDGCHRDRAIAGVRGSLQKGREEPEIIHRRVW